MEEDQKTTILTKVLTNHTFLTAQIISILGSQEIQIWEIG